MYWHTLVIWLGDWLIDWLIDWLNKAHSKDYSIVRFMPDGMQVSFSRRFFIGQFIRGRLH